MSRRDWRIGVAGLGTVGSAFGPRTVPLPSVWSLWEAVMGRLRDPGFPISVAERHRLEPWRAAFHAMLRTAIAPANGA